MRFGFLLLLGLFCWLGWKTWRFVQGGQSMRERAVAMRGAMAFWLLGFISLVGFVFTPMPFKLLLAIPLFLVSGSVVKAFRDVRTRMREEQSGQGNVDKMKRIN
jgi:hypothetical protein